MVKGHADLKDTLIEMPDGTRLGHPQLFQCVVTLIELPPIELLNAFEQAGWWRFTTGCRHG
jgi:hypothetical protein